MKLSTFGASSGHLVGSLSIGHFLSDFYGTFLPAIIPLITLKLHLSLSAAGILVLVYSFTACILQPVFGYYIDKHGWSGCILLTIPISAIFIVLTGLVTSYEQALLCICIAGLASSLFHPLGTVMLNRVAAGYNSSLPLALFIGGGNLGVTLAPLFVFAFIHHFGLEALPWLCLPGLAISLLYYCFSMHKLPVASSPSSRPSGPPWYRSLPLLKLNLIMGLRSWPQSVIPNFLFLWLAARQLPTAPAASLITCFFAGGAAGSIGGGYLGDRLGKRRCILFSLLLTIPALLFFCQTDHPDSLGSYALLFLAGAGLQASLPSSILWAQELIPHQSAMASGMMLGLSFGLGGLGAALTGALADHIGLYSAFLWSLLPLLAASLLTWSLHEKPAAFRQPET